MSLLQPRIDLAKQRIPKAENAGVPKWTQLRVQCRNSINNPCVFDWNRPERLAGWASIRRIFDGLLVREKVTG
jgi:hypothetical protein